MKKYFLSISLFFVSIVMTHGQNVVTSKIKWNSENTFQVVTGDNLQEETTLITDNSNSIEWRKADNTLLKKFTIQEILGSWSNINSNGVIRYKIIESDNNGTLTISKSNTDVKILIIVDSVNPTMIELSITGYTQL